MSNYCPSCGYMYCVCRCYPELENYWRTQRLRWVMREWKKAEDRDKYEQVVRNGIAALS